MRFLFFILGFATSSSLFSQNLKENTSLDFATPPKIAWKYKTNGPIFSSPIADNNLIYFTSLDSTLYVIESLKGALKWKFKTAGPIRSAACLGKEAVYLQGGDGILYCLNKASGKLLWSFKTMGGTLGERQYDFADYYQSPPVLNEGKVLFGSGDGRVYALNEVTGSLMWIFQAQDIIHTAPVVQNQRVFFGSYDGFFYALSETDGRLLWKFKSVGHRYFPKGEFQGSIAVSKGLVFVASRDYNLYALDQVGGYCHWNKQFQAGWAMSLSTSDSILYTGTSDDKLFFAFDPLTGKELWKVNTGFNVFGETSFSGNMAFVGTLMGKVLGIDLKAKSVAWAFETEDYKLNRVKYFNEEGAYKSNIMTTLKTSEDYIQMLHALGAIFSKPLIQGNYIIITSTNGCIYALKSS